MADESNSDRVIQMMKASLPFISQNTGVMFAQYIRVSEIMGTLSRVEREQDEILATCDIHGDDEDRQYGLYQAIRGYCTPREQDMLDLFINFSQLSKLQRNFDSEQEDSFYAR